MQWQWPHIHHQFPAAVLIIGVLLDGHAVTVGKAFALSEPFGPLKSGRNQFTRKPVHSCLQTKGRTVQQTPPRLGENLWLQKQTIVAKKTVIHQRSEWCRQTYTYQGIDDKPLIP